MVKRPIMRTRKEKSVSRFLPLRALFRLKNKIQNLSKKAYKRAKVFGGRIMRRVDQKPLTSFFTLLAILLVLIILGSFLRRPSPEKIETQTAKEVQIYSIGKAPKVTVQAQIEKSGIVKIVALTPGVVTNINVVEGQEVGQGTNLVSIGSNYSGGNAASIQRQIAAATYQNVKDTYDTQKDLIAKQREAADKQDANADELRDIASKSLDDTKNLINLNNDIVNTLQSNLASLIAGNTNGTNNQAILSTKQMTAQYQSGLAQLNSQLRSAEYSANGDKPAAALANISREIAQKQLDIQEKALKLSQETSALSLQLAQTQEAAFYPSAPFAGVVERVYVTPGESVNPGTPLVVIHGAQKLKLVAKVPRNVAQTVSLFDASTIYMGEKTIKITPSYVSGEATDGSLYSIDFQIPEGFQNKVSDNEFLTVDIPISTAQTSAAIPFIPVDSVYQTETNAYVFVNKNGVARAKSLKLGQVLGSYVEVSSGLNSGDQVILTRSVIAGDMVKAAE